MNKKPKEKGKIGKFFSLLGRNFATLHRMVWGTGWRRFILAVVVTIVILLAVLTITLEVTSTPKFCNSCHNMKPYYDSWKDSSHKHVTCTDCHFPPGIKNKIKGKFTALSMLVNYFTGIYKRSKPWAEISDESCMRSGCHETRLLTGNVNYKKGINFDHAPHLNNLRRGKTLRCTSCHSQIVQGSHISVTENTCFLCHFKSSADSRPINDCLNCHTPPVANKQADKPELIAYDHTMVLSRKIDCRKCHGDMEVGDGTVPKLRCSNCHADQEKIKHYSDGDLMHKNHITDHKIECEQCHTEIQHKSVSRSESVKPDCNACHPNFHNAQLLLFSGKGGRNLPDHPSPMYQSGLNCQACHLYHQSADDFNEKGTVVKASAKSCEPCHGTGYNKMLDRWKNQTDRSMNKLASILDNIEKKISGNKKAPDYEEARKKMEDARYNYKLVKFGNSIHNISFANRLMESSYQSAKASLESAGIRQKVPPFRTQAPITPGDCSNCHAGLELIQLRVFGWNYSHAVHIKQQGLSCNRCHSNEQKHGQLIIAKNDCMSCHHQDALAGKEPDCKRCHETQHQVYYSKLPFSTLDVPNVMVTDVACLDCHQNEDDQLYRPTKTVCSNCHEEDYEEMFVEWEKTAMELVRKLRQKIEYGKLPENHPVYETLILLQRDGSKGIHNPELYEQLVEEALKK